MADSISIDSFQLAQGQAPFIVAEMSGNHNQSLDRALAIVDAAAECGCHALKIQTYTADTLTINVDSGLFKISDQKSLWQGRSLHDLYAQAYTPWEWHQPIFDRCKQRGLIAFSTPFDDTAVDFLEQLNAPLYKIASFENTHLPLIKKVAATGKPIIVSTGMASVGELQELVQTVRQTGNQKLILLKCTSAYPAPASAANLKTISHLAEMFDCLVGLSDHTAGIGVAVAAVTMGACLVEKHFTLDRSAGGPDASFSLEPSEMTMLVQECQRAHAAIGTVSYERTSAEEKSIMFRRSVFIVENVAAGEVLNEKNIRIIRPGYGLAPKYFEKCLGKRASKALRRGTPLSWEMIE